MTRYIDDWGYQANVRKVVKAQLHGMRGGSLFDVLNEEKYFATERCRTLMQDFANKNLDKVQFDGGFNINFPWNRMFESDITYKIKS